MTKIIYTITAENLIELEMGFLKVRPVPKDKKTGAPVMSEIAWLKECGKQFFMSGYRDGKKLLAREQAQIEKELII